MVLIPERLDKEIEGRIYLNASLHLIEYNNEKHVLIFIFNFLQQILKMDQIKLAEEAWLYTKCVGDMNQMSSIIMSKCEYLSI